MKRNPDYIVFIQQIGFDQTQSRNIAWTSPVTTHLTINIINGLGRVTRPHTFSLDLKNTTETLYLEEDLNPKEPWSSTTSGFFLNEIIFYKN